MASDFTNTHMHCIAAGLAMLELLHCRNLHLTHPIEQTHTQTYTHFHTSCVCLWAAVNLHWLRRSSWCLSKQVPEHLYLFLSLSISITPRRRAAFSAKQYIFILDWYKIFISIIKAQTEAVEKQKKPLMLKQFTELGNPYNTVILNDYCINVPWY